MKAKHILLGISAAALAGLIGYNACMADGNKAVPAVYSTMENKSPEKKEEPQAENPRILGDRDTLTIDYSKDYGEFGTKTYIFQQFGKDCEMRYIEIRNCPNARRNGDVQYGCNAIGARDYGCDGVVDEVSSAQIGKNVASRSGREYLFEATKVDSLFATMQEVMGLSAGISLEDEINKWENSAQ